MSQRMALVLAGALTAFVFVLMAGVGATVAVKSLATTNVANSAQTNFIEPPVAAQPENASSNFLAVSISQDQAAQIVLRQLPNATLTRAPELVSFQGAVAYEVALNQGNVYVDANSGKVLFNSATASTASPARSGERHREGERDHENEEGDDD